MEILRKEEYFRRRFCKILRSCVTVRMFICNCIVSFVLSVVLVEFQSLFCGLCSIMILLFIVF